MRIVNHPILEDLPKRKKLFIIVDGMEIEAYEGESIAAAMMAAGIRVYRRTPHFHEPRGIFCNLGRCIDYVMKVNGRPHVRTCITRVQEGMIVESIEGIGQWE
ncbi:MAG: (2Fe-2S)-binding protein [Thermodesulfovibrionales bacterium]